MDEAESLFESWFRPRLEHQLSRTHPILSEQQKGQLTRWAELLVEADESLLTRSKQRQSVRRRARTFARNVRVISRELFNLCSLSFTISALPSIPDGTFYDYLQTWSTAHIPNMSLTENAKQTDQGVPSKIATNNDSSTLSAPPIEPGDFTLRRETEIPQDLINLRDTPQNGLIDMMTTGELNV